jgi:hypothetical protein
MLKFDMRALQDVLDGERRARKLTWDQLAAEIKEPFKHTPSIPISVGTLRTMTTKRSSLALSCFRFCAGFGRTPESAIIPIGWRIGKKLTVAPFACDPASTPSRHIGRHYSSSSSNSQDSSQVWMAPRKNG